MNPGREKFWWTSPSLIVYEMESLIEPDALKSRIRNMRWIAGIFILGLLLCSPGNRVCAQQCAYINALWAAFQEKPFISLEYLQLTKSDIFGTTDSLKGKLWAGRAGCFRLEMPGQIVGSDGTIYWSYSIENKQILVDSVNSLEDWNPITLLYDPQKIYRCRSESSTDGELAFELTATDSLVTPAALSLCVDRKTLYPRKLVYRDDNGSQIEVLIEKYVKSQHCPDSLFQLRSRPGVEIIRMP